MAVETRTGAAAIELGVGVPTTALGGAEVASGLVNGNPVLILSGVAVLACGGVSLGFALRNSLEAIITARLLRQDGEHAESLERK